jgi:hypothetical protein
MLGAKIPSDYPVSGLRNKGHAFVDFYGEAPIGNPLGRFILYNDSADFITLSATLDGNERPLMKWFYNASLTPSACIIVLADLLTQWPHANIGQEVSPFNDFHIINVYAQTLVQSPLLKTDAIQEKTFNAGITIDGVLCKDSMIDNVKEWHCLDPAYGAIAARFHQTGSNIWALVKESGTEDLVFDVTELRCTRFNAKATYWTINTDQDYGEMWFRGLRNNNTIYFKLFNSSLANLRDVLQAQAGGLVPDGEPRLHINYAGNIIIQPDNFLQIGKDSDGALPTADASYRGKMIRVEGGAGVPDKLYMCMKSAADTYSWVQVAMG